VKNIFEQLTDLLRKDERLVSQDGVLLKNQTQELARKNDLELIKLLLSDKTIKQHFFFEVEKTLIFDKEKFVRFVSNKQFLPDSYTAFKNKIGLTAGDEYVSENKEVVLAWPYKDCILEGGMTKEDQKRDEIFYNETLAPDDINRLLDAKVFTNFKRIDKDGEHPLSSPLIKGDKGGFRRDEKGTIKDNLIIKGNNLLALASLKKEFAGKVKLIYIDPPYNTGNDGFKYNDSFNHSSWLVFMKNRLEIAKSLLREDGSIWINIDDDESHYLKVLSDSIFGRENFVANVIWEKSDSPRMDVKLFSIRHDNILVYSKNIALLSFNLEIDQEIPKHYNKKDEHGKIYYLKPLRVMGGNISKSLFFPMIAPDGTKVLPVEKNGQEGCWRWSKEKVKEENNRIEWVKGRENWTPYFRIYADDRKAMPLETIWSHEDVGSNRTSKNELKKIIEENIFDTPKPEKLLQKIIISGSKTEDIVLDFFAGSGTTLAVAHKIGRQYIGIEQMDYIHELPESRLKKVIAGEQGGISKAVNWKGGGDFVYMELAKWNEEWIEKIKKAKTGKELAKLWDEMKETAFLSYKIEPKTIDANVKTFSDLSIADQKKFLIECLDKNQLYVNLSEIEDKEYNVNNEDKELNRNFYGQ